MSKENDTPETVQTVQTGQRPPWIEVAEDENGKWHWLMWSGNGRQVATNAVPYDRKKDAIAAAKTLVRTAGQVKNVVQCH